MPTTEKPLFIELYNASNKDIQATDLIIGEYDAKRNQILNPNVLSKKPLIWKAKSFLVLSSKPVQSNCSSIVNANFSNFLNSSVKALILVDQDFNVLDEMQYSQQMYSPETMNMKGVSLERISYYKDATDKSNWQPGAKESNYWSPGCANVAVEQVLLAQSPFKLVKNVIQSGLAGADGILVLEYALPSSGYTFNSQVYREDGSHFGPAFVSASLEQKGSLFWDGKVRERALKPGNYTITVKAISESGDFINLQFPIQVK